MAIGLSAILIAAAIGLFGITLASSWFSDCPKPTGEMGQLTGLDKGISLWPPGAQCYGAGNDLYIHEALPWAKPLIVTLLGSSSVLLALGLVASIVRMRAPKRGLGQP